MNYAYRQLPKQLFTVLLCLSLSACGLNGSSSSRPSTEKDKPASEQPAKTNDNADKPQAKADDKDTTKDKNKDAPATAPQATAPTVPTQDGKPAADKAAPQVDTAGLPAAGKPSPGVAAPQAQSQSQQQPQPAPRAESDSPAPPEAPAPVAATASGVEQAGAKADGEAITALDPQTLAAAKEHIKKLKMYQNILQSKQAWVLETQADYNGESEQFNKSFLSNPKAWCKGSAISAAAVGSVYAGYVAYSTISVTAVMGMIRNAGPFARNALSKINLKSIRIIKKPKDPRLADFTTAIDDYVGTTPTSGLLAFPKKIAGYVASATKSLIKVSLALAAGSYAYHFVKDTVLANNEKDMETKSLVEMGFSQQDAETFQGAFENTAESITSDMQNLEKFKVAVDNTINKYSDNVGYWSNLLSFCSKEENRLIQLNSVIETSLAAVQMQIDAFSSLIQGKDSSTTPEPQVKSEPAAAAAARTK